MHITSDVRVMFGFFTLALMFHLGTDATAQRKFDEGLQAIASRLSGAVIPHQPEETNRRQVVNEDAHHQSTIRLIHTPRTCH